MGSLKIGSLPIAQPQNLSRLAIARLAYSSARQTAENMESEGHVVRHNGKLRYTSKGSSGTLQALPDSCCARSMSYLKVREVELVGECSLKSKVRACSRELWLMLCEQRWPAIASSEALRKAVMMRHPRDYFMHTYLEHHLPRPLLDLDEHLVHLEIRQKGRSIYSVAREARDVFRSEVAAYREWSFRAGEYHNPAGILFDDISAKVDCSDDDTFPPEAEPVTVTYYVIRKSDGHMAILVDDDSFGQAAGGADFGGDAPFNAFPQYPTLTGMLPMNCNCWSRLQHKNLTKQERQVCSSLGWRDTRKRDNYFEICTALHVGTMADGTGTERMPAPEATEPPRAVVTPGQVEIRELFMQFSGDLYSDEPNTTREVDEYRISSEELDLEDIRSVLAQHLRFG